MAPIVLLNGPPGSGKDLIAGQLSSTLDVQTCEAKQALYTKFFDYYAEQQRLHGLPETFLTQDARDAWKATYLQDRTRKDAPCDDLPNRITPREGMIYVAENVIKPKYGASWFAEKLVEDIQKRRATASIVVVSDVGFPEEVQAIVRSSCAKGGVVLCHVHRAGTTFAGDSRTYVNDPTITKQVDAVIDAFNDSTNGDVAGIVEEILRTVKHVKNP